MNRYINSFPNQRSVNINKEKCSVEKLYTKINISAMNHAMQDLKSNAYKLWCYFAENQDQYSFWLSMVDVRNTTGMSESSFHRAFAELVVKFYLVRDNVNGKHYNFYEIPYDVEKHNVKAIENK